MNISKLTTEAKKEALNKIAVGLQNLDDEMTHEVLHEIVHCFDELDGDDFFGPEGWKHFFGLDD